MVSFYNLVATCLVAGLVGSSVQGRQAFQRTIPNGAAVPSPCEQDVTWNGVGHKAQGGGGPLNPFGMAYRNSGWTRALCLADSDGDGKSNGAELGDPNCQWPRVAAGPATGHPGICEPVDNATCQAKQMWLNSSNCVALANSGDPNQGGNTGNMPNVWGDPIPGCTCFCMNMTGQMGGAPGFQGGMGGNRGNSHGGNQGGNHHGRNRRDTDDDGDDDTGRDHGRGGRGGPGGRGGMPPMPATDNVPEFQDPANSIFAPCYCACPTPAPL